MIVTGLDADLELGTCLLSVTRLYGGRVATKPHTPIPSIEIRPQFYDRYYGTTPHCQPSSPTLPANTGNRVSEPVLDGPLPQGNLR